AGASGTTGDASPIPSNPDTPVGAQPAPSAGGGNPGVGGGELTVPQPGQLDVHPVPAELLESAVDGHNVTIRITWTSGVEPCNVLDTILVDRTGDAIAITLREGHAVGNKICIEIAKQKHALVDLGELEPGTYTISDAVGGAAPIQVVVS
ncbi:MAG TPA: hypothetical protein VFW02_04785, partial [Candidatus Limnocylindrales bacterium]|nr:hypothetical protein [Candidatus Limnocylindrales bacterium]